MNFREGWKRKLPISRPYRKEYFKRLVIDWSHVEEDLEKFVDFSISHMEPGYETDFLAITDHISLIAELVGRIEECGFEEVHLGVHHEGVTIPK